jgi:hypothetical protein
MKLVKHKKRLSVVKKANQEQLEKFMTHYHKFIRENTGSAENIPLYNSVDGTYDWINDTIKLLDENGLDTGMGLFATDSGIYHNSISSYIDVIVYLYYLLNHLDDEFIHAEFNENDNSFRIDSDLYTAEGRHCFENPCMNPLDDYQVVSICKRVFP